MTDEEFEAAERGRDVTLGSGAEAIDAALGLPRGRPRGLVLVVHARARSSPPERLAARVLRDAGFATLLADLGGSEAGARGGSAGALAAPLSAAVQAAASLPETRGVALGLLGAGAGAAAALALAAERPDDVAAVVGAGGGDALPDAPLERVRAPTLLLVGERDAEGVEAAREAFGRLGATKEIAIVPGASSLADAPAALDEVARRAADWFAQSLGARRPAARAATGGAPR